MTRTNHKPSLQSRSKQRIAVIAERAGVMRGSPTATEERLWDRVRGRRPGVVIRRQVPLLGRFIADFYAPARRLAIEIDGAYHAERARADARRNAALERAGYRIVWVEASLIVSDIESALALIRASRPSAGVGPSTPDAAPRRAARGGGSDGCVLPNGHCFAGFGAATSQLVRAALGLVGSSHARGAPPAPAPARALFHVVCC